MGRLIEAADGGSQQVQKTRARTWTATSSLANQVMRSTLSYSQVRCLFETGRLWEPHVAEASPCATGRGQPVSGSVSGLVTRSS